MEMERGQKYKNEIYEEEIEEMEIYERCGRPDDSYFSTDEHEEIKEIRDIIGDLNEVDVLIYDEEKYCALKVGAMVFPCASFFKKYKQYSNFLKERRRRLDEIYDEIKWMDYYGQIRDYNYYNEGIE